MAGSINKVILVGNVGRDPEIRSLGNGDQVASLSIATSDRWKDKNSGERKERTEWHKVSVFQKGLVGVIEKYVTKGTQLYVEGQLRTRKYTTQDGQEKYSTEIVLSGYDGTMQILGGGNSGRSESAGDSSYGASGYGGGASAEKPSSGPTWKDKEIDDEIPF